MSKTPRYWNKAKQILSKRDRVMKKLICDYKDGSLITRNDIFFSLCKSIIGQQISVAAANSVFLKFKKKCKNNDLDLHFFQSNIEGHLIEEIHKAINDACGIIINAGALTHTSIGILDALKMFEGPKIEIHITNVYARESFRHQSFISPVATGIIAGLGVNSYLLAIEAIKDLIKD